MNHIKKAIGKLFLFATVSISSFAGTPDFEPSNCIPCTSNKTSEMIDPVLIFKQVNERLASLKKVQYHYLKEFNYPEENYVAKSEGDMYIEFDKEHDLAGIRFQYRDERGFIIFNNSELFSGNKKTQTIELSTIKSETNLEGKSPLYNSIITLKNIFPILLKDQTIKKSVIDTLINQKSCYSLRFFLHNKLINYLGTGYATVTKELTFNYQIIVDKNTLMPQTIVQTTVNSQSVNRTDFTAVNTSPSPVSESSWFYSNYFDNYKTRRPESTSCYNQNR